MIEVQINDVPYTSFLEYSFERDMETINSAFAFTLSTLDGGIFPIQRNSKVKVLIDGKPFCNGYVDKVSIGYSSSDHTISVSGRDKTQDIIDSTLDTTIELKTPITLQNVIQSVLNYLGITDIKIINQAGALEPFKKSELISGAIGQSCFDFLDEYCAKREVILTTDGNGNILLTQGEGTVIDGQLIHQINGNQNNIISAQVEFDDAKRFNQYIVKSQLNSTAIAEQGTDTAEDEIIVTKGSTVNANVRTTRKLVIQAETACTNQTAQDRALKEKVFRDARSQSYNVVTNGFNYNSQEGSIWEPLQIVKVIDEFAQINDNLLIRKVSHSLSLNEGSKTILELVPKIAYNFRPDKVKFKNKKENSGGSFIPFDKNA